MTLRRRTLLITGIILIVLISVISITFQAILGSSINKLEKQSVTENAERVQQAINENIEGLSSFVGDWGPWDDTYKFTLDHNGDFVARNLTDATFVNYNVNVILFIDKEGYIVYGKALDLDTERMVPIPKGLIDNIKKSSLTSRFSYNFTVKGIIALPDGPMLVASSPILTSNHEGPVVGNMVVGRFLDTVEVEDLAKRTRLGVSIKTLENTSDANFQKVSEANPTVLNPVDDNTIEGYSIIKDIYGQPIVGTIIKAPRRAHSVGESSSRLMLVSLLVLGLVCIITVLWFLEKNVLSRLHDLSQSVKSISTKGTIETRLPLDERNDEFKIVSGEINRMLEQLDKSQQAIYKSEKKFRTFVEKAQDIVYSLDKDGVCTYISPNCSTTIGYAPNDFIGKPFDYNMHQDNRAEWSTYLKSRTGTNDFSETFEYRSRKQDGSWEWLATSLSISEDADSNEHQFIGIVRNIDKRMRVEAELREAHDLLEKRVEERTAELAETNKVLQEEIAEREKTQAEIKYLAYYDHLTGLPNRSLAMDRLSQAILFAQRARRPLAVMFLDIDNFKIVNDTVGHTQGDELLSDVGRRLKESVRAVDTIARVGGDEFIIIVQDLEDENAVHDIANRILNSFKMPFALKDIEHYVTASIGIALYPADGSDADTLINNADIAMYKAKKHGRNEYMLCTPSMKSSLVEQMQLSNYLHRALERNELMLYYQPQVNSHTGRIVGIEALLRWKHPELGFISPAKIIPIAEQTGLIMPIGEWVLKTACEQNKKLQDKGLAHIKMAVNLSINQFQSPKIADRVERILKETGLDAHYLELEITESIAMNEADYVVDILQSFKELGITISIDDFGTEYSSLQYLKQIPIDKIKIAMPFIRGISVNDKDEAIIKTIIVLAKSLGLNVIAEGVETQEQLAFLAKNLCEDIQGYYYYKPMSAGELEDLLQKEGLKDKAS